MYPASAPSPAPAAAALPPAAALQRLDALITQGGRRLLGLAGPPGAGKSTLAEALHRARPQHTVIVPMDGFHLAQAELERLGRAARKGAPDTFDAAGFVHLLRRLRHATPDEVVYAPAFRREIEEPVAGAVPVPATVPVLLVEGNYLLLEEGAWAGVRPLLDACWYVGVDPDLRVSRLVARHIHHGRSPEAAAAWVARSDEANARRIEASAHRADWVCPLD
ncbi:nucleoside/nucleotide kinase family protein [Ideonella livida]|uniref:Nucleoside/nucleotide kinase family protein n=1 Tax=Ideonella livida TaxID=2707176 RepID=A0A7C9TJ86_9BURK|nr:nucleoside/nucleotide kinase family protein [Ideonella livida]NDY91578.1 nucleoside/nucleotide kinase family protein [Ideonella livida]